MFAPLATQGSSLARQGRLADAQDARRAARIQKDGAQAEDSTMSSSTGQRHAPPVKKRRLGSAGEVQALRIYKPKVNRTNPPNTRTGTGGEEEWAKSFDGDFYRLPIPYQDGLGGYFATQVKMCRKLDAMYQADTFNNINNDNYVYMDSFDLLGSLFSRIEFALEIGMCLGPKDILNLYCVSRDFHQTISLFMTGTLRSWAAAMAPSSARFFPFEVYKRLCIPDLAGRREVTKEYKRYSGLNGDHCLYPVTQYSNANVRGNVVFTQNIPGELRQVPSLVWLQMVGAREVRVHDILAVLARSGLRVPQRTHEVLKKLWLVMDVATNRHRQQLMGNCRFFSNEDLYIAQLFLVKLHLHVNDPIYGPGAGDIVRLLMGQRAGLTPLWRFLRGKAYTTPCEFGQLRARYNKVVTPAEAEAGMSVLDVPAHEVGTGHLEGWGRGKKHLLRPDELVVAEATRRQLDLAGQLEAMLAYGCVDPTTGADLVPTLEELYMSDDELDRPAPGREGGIHDGAGNVPFRDADWTPKLVRKARWDELTAAEREAVLADDRDEIRVGEAWEDDSELDFNPFPDDFDIEGETDFPTGGGDDLSSICSIGESVFSDSSMPTDESDPSAPTGSDVVTPPARPAPFHMDCDDIMPERRRKWEGEGDMPPESSSPELDGLSNELSRLLYANSDDEIGDFETRYNHWLDCLMTELCESDADSVSGATAVGSQTANEDLTGLASLEYADEEIPRVNQEKARMERLRKLQVYEVPQHNYSLLEPHLRAKLLREEEEEMLSQNQYSRKW